MSPNDRHVCIRIHYREWSMAGMAMAEFAHFPHRPSCKWGNYRGAWETQARLVFQNHTITRSSLAHHPIIHISHIILCLVVLMCPCFLLKSQLPTDRSSWTDRVTILGWEISSSTSISCSLPAVWPGVLGIAINAPNFEIVARRLNRNWGGPWRLSWALKRG